MKKDKRELGKLRLLVSITLASICVRDLKRDLECRVRCTKRIYIKAQAQPAFMVVHLLTFGKRGGPVMIVHFDSRERDVRVISQGGTRTSECMKAKSRNGKAETTNESS